MEPDQIYEVISKGGFRISTDTRKILPGDIYIGIKGDQFDGNAFAYDALEKGASYALIDNPDYTDSNNGKIILVENTKNTLKKLAHIHRKTFACPIVVIGGSNGKTTTKELTASVLSKKYRVHTTQGNLNNDIGVPLTLLSMNQKTTIAVIEIGANHPGEHTELMDIVCPTHVLVTNNGADHLEGFGSLEGARKANAEIYDWAKKHEIPIFVNKTIPDLVQDSAGKQQYLYPTKEWEGTSTLLASLVYNNTPITSSLFGTYNEPNILAAIAIGEFFGVPLEDTQKAIDEYQPSLKRSQIIKNGSTTIVLDCYNANPTSMEKAIVDFATHTPPGKRIFLIGDMLEMGDVEKKMHSDIVELLKKIVDPDDQIILVGPRFKTLETLAPFTFFETTEDARNHFETLLLDKKHILLKASRGIKLEEILKEKVPF